MSEREIIKFIYGSLKTYNELVIIKSKYPKTYNKLCYPLVILGMLLGFYIILLAYIIT